MKRWLLVIGGFALALTMVAGGTARLVNAQDSMGTPTTESQVSDQSYLSALAGELGVTEEVLQAAMESAREQVGVGQVGGWHKGGERAGGRHGNARSWSFTGEGLQSFAALLGISTDELLDEMQSGMNILQVAEAHGVTQDAVRDYLIEQATTRIDEKLAELASAAVGGEAAETGTPTASI
ncbi:MAG: hypothetical protein R2839_01805 [Thermomicrobiales bacterium]